MAAAQLLAFLYLVLLAVHIPLPFGETGGSLFLEDLLFPWLVAWLCINGKSLLARWKEPPMIFFLLFLLWGGISTCCHIAVDCSAEVPLASAFAVNLREWAIFFYMAVLFLFFAEVEFARSVKYLLALIFFLAFDGCYIWDLKQAFAGGIASFHYAPPADLGGTAFSFLSHRYAFCFGNPNLSSIFLAVPWLIFVQLYLKQEERKGFFFWLLSLVAFLSLIPLAATLSKHLILVVGILIFFLGTTKLFLRSAKEGWLLRSRWLLLLLLIGAFEVTVLFVTFPLRLESPRMDTTPGMYTIHQRVYWKLSQEKNGRLIGQGHRLNHEKYPRFVDAESADKTLSHHGFENQADCFKTFMDPHCEYLNLQTLFGWPCLVLMVVLLICLGCRSPLAFYFVLALFGAMLWDDLLSKRAIWIALGLLFCRVQKVEPKSFSKPLSQDI